MASSRLHRRQPLRLIWTADARRYEACFEARGEQLLRVPCQPAPGIGDVVAHAAQAAGVAECGGCAWRRWLLNRLTPEWLRRALARWLT